MSSLFQRLDGEWEIARDPGNNGKENQWFLAKPQSDIQPIRTPGPIQEAFPFYDGVAWYFKTFTVMANPYPGGRFFLQFGSVDYLCEVWLNGIYLGSHEDSEEPFQFDVTRAVLESQDNFLAMRVVNPCETPIDGLQLSTIPHRNKFNLNYFPGASLNFSGITGPVTLSAEHPVRISGLTVHSDWQSGDVEFLISISNNTGSAAIVRLDIQISEVAESRHVLGIDRVISASCGETSHKACVRISGYHLWSTGDPFLYHAALSLSQGDAAPLSYQAVRFGFKDFRVQNGFFHLNGKRMFLRCAHTGNCLPVGGVTSRNPDLVMRDLHYAKALGFNTVRFIAGVPLALQLDLCDEIGLLVYEECYAGWCLGDSPRVDEYFTRSAGSMMKRDRNHVCVAIWGLLNETVYGNVFKSAFNFLPLARELDETRLIILSSGRWDEKPEIGSVSNPFSHRWEYEWGFESEKGRDAIPDIGKFKPVSPFTWGMGDGHAYPEIPHSENDRQFIRTLGESCKPVFLSEYGVGSQNNIVQEFLKFEENGERTDLEDASLYKRMVDQLLHDWQFYDLDGIYLFPEDFLKDSIKLNGRQRQLSFDLVRSNPMLCGYSLTGLLDHALTGEGLWTFWREFKPGLADIVREGWAPLRWSLFSSRRCVRAGAPLTIEAVLCNEDVLTPGRYPAVFRIKGKDGIVFDRQMDIILPESGFGGKPPLAVPVFSESITLAEPGEYEFGAALLRGGSPAGGRLAITAAARCGPVKTSQAVASWNIPENAALWLSSHGVHTVDFGKSGGPVPNLILVGDPPPFDGNSALWAKLQDFVSAGAVAVLFAPVFTGTESTPADYLPFTDKGKFVRQAKSLYHTDNIHARHPLFQDIHGEGIAEHEVFGSLYPDMMYISRQKPSRSICAAIGVGQTNTDGYASGLSAGEFSYGKGKIVINCFKVLESAGDNPLADLMLRNILA